MDTEEKDTIEKVVLSDLCAGCGTCLSMCPTQAITLVKDGKRGLYIPKLEQTKCNQCGICFEVCPGYSVDYKQLNRAVFGKEPEDILVGNYTNCYIGHATDYEIRYNSASGGLVTTLLVFALEEGLIDGALVTRMGDSNPLEPEVFIARTKEEIISASKSKYCPVPANIALREILESGKDERFAVVGLPCQIQGIRKAEIINEKLKGKIVLRLGLFCGSNHSFLGTDFLLRQMKIEKGVVKRIDYRGGGWPGQMRFKLANGSVRSIPSSKGWDICGFNSNFLLTRCVFCSDGSSELADVSFGDAWKLPEVSEDKIGSSLVISRTEVGEKILHNAVSKGKIELDRINSDKVMQSQGRMLYRKKRDLGANVSIFRLLGKKVPLYNSELLKPKPTAYLNAISLYLQLRISSRRHLWGLVRTYISLRPYILGIILTCAGYCLSKVRGIHHFLKYKYR